MNRVPVKYQLAVSVVYDSSAVITHKSRVFEASDLPEDKEDLDDYFGTMTQNGITHCDRFFDGDLDAGMLVIWDTVINLNKVSAVTFRTFVAYEGQDSNLVWEEYVYG